MNYQELIEKRVAEKSAKYEKAVVFSMRNCGVYGNLAMYYFFDGDIFHHMFDIPTWASADGYKYKKSFEEIEAKCMEEKCSTYGLQYFIKYGKIENKITLKKN